MKILNMKTPYIKVSGQLRIVHYDDYIERITWIQAQRMDQRVRTTSLALGVLFVFEEEKDFLLFTLKFGLGDTHGKEFPSSSR